MSRFTAETLIKDAEFSRRVFNALVRDGMTTLGDVCECTEEYLKRIPNIGKGSLAEIEEVLAAAKLHLHVGPMAGHPHGRRAAAAAPRLPPQQEATGADLREAYRALAEQRAWYANAGKIDLRKWCVEMAIRWPVVHFRTGQDMGYINPASATDADVIGRAEKIWDWVRAGDR